MPSKSSEILSVHDRSYFDTRLRLLQLHGSLALACIMPSWSHRLRRPWDRCSGSFYWHVPLNIVGEITPYVNHRSPPSPISTSSTAGTNLGRSLHAQMRIAVASAEVTVLFTRSWPDHRHPVGQAGVGHLVGMGRSHHQLRCCCGSCMSAIMLVRRFSSGGRMGNTDCRCAQRVFAGRRRADCLHVHPLVADPAPGAGSHR